MIWTDFDDRFIRIFYPKYGKYIGRSINRTPRAIQRRASILGVKLLQETVYKINQKAHSYESKNQIRFIEELPNPGVINSIEEYEEYNRRVIQMMSFRNIIQSK